MEHACTYRFGSACGDEVSCLGRYRLPRMCVGREETKLLLAVKIYAAYDIIQTNLNRNT